MMRSLAPAPQLRSGGLGAGRRLMDDIRLSLLRHSRSPLFSPSQCPVDHLPYSKGSLSQSGKEMITMVEQQPATLLAVLVANSERTQEEIVDEFLRCAREHQEKATLTVRTLQRWMKGGVQTAPRPAQRRVARIYWGYPMTTLLSPPPPPATPIRPPAFIPPRAALTART